MLYIKNKNLSLKRFWGSHLRGRPVVYGKKYLLYNFCVGLYYKLPIKNDQISVLGN